MRTLPRPNRANNERASGASLSRGAAEVAAFTASFASAVTGGLAAMSAIAPIGCLPGDTRPVPERVNVTAEPGPGLTHGIETADGWRVTFERFLIGLGNIDFDSDDAACNSYAEAHYDRLFDFVVAGREKVGTVYGLGTCRIDFRLRAPSTEAVLGPGATAGDVTFMRERGTDGYTENERISVLAIGAAARGGQTKRFDWVFRRSYEIRNCMAEGVGFSTTVELTEASSSELRIEVRPEELFLAGGEHFGELGFQRLADADGDGDGIVTLDELAKVPAGLAAGPGLGQGGAPGVGDAGSPDAGADASLPLGAVVYEVLLPRVVRVAGGGLCEAEDRTRGAALGPPAP